LINATKGERFLGIEKQGCPACRNRVGPCHIWDCCCGAAPGRASTGAHRHSL